MSKKGGKKERKNESKRERKKERKRERRKKDFSNKNVMPNEETVLFIISSFSQLFQMLVFAPKL